MYSLDPRQNLVGLETPDDDVEVNRASDELALRGVYAGNRRAVS